MKYCFTLDGRKAMPERDTWEDAAKDAVSAGYASWKKDGKTLMLDTSQGAAIEEIPMAPIPPIMGKPIGAIKFPPFNPNSPTMVDKVRAHLRDMPLWLIWSNEHDAWWKPNSSGYTVKREQAGLYTTKEAEGICRARDPVQYKRGPYGAAVPAEVMVPGDELLKFLRNE